MSRHTLAIPMSQIIASDAPLLSPVSPVGDSPWDQLCIHSSTTDNFPFGYYDPPPSPPTSTSTGSTTADSPIPTSRMLKMRMSPESGSDSEQQQFCLPTHQLFDLPEDTSTPPLYSPSSPKLQPIPVSINSFNPTPVKRSASPAPSVTKKPRGGERINSKDFVPPDVSGLSKREARLVKNRAAAFLSRQRKREEFEFMEVRVAKLEQENARLLALAQNGSGCAQSANLDGNAEIDRLKAQLAAAEERERELSAELKSKSTSSRDTLVKAETVEHEFPSSSTSRSTSVIQSHKSGASLGLMVLLCALPTLLSMPAQSTLPTTFSLPISSASPFSASSSAFDYSSLIPNDWDWSNNPSNLMDLDIDNREKISSGTFASTTGSRRLEFVDGAPAGLGDLDISFDAYPSDDRRILVRIRPSSSPSRSQSPVSPSPLAMWAGPQDSGMHFSQSMSSLSHYSFPSSFGYDTPSDPFLGIGSTSEFAPLYSSDASDMSGDFRSTESGIGIGSAGDCGAKRRVRIALKTMPTPGGEGGEWEVQVC